MIVYDVNDVVQKTIQKVKNGGSLLYPNFDSYSSMYVFSTENLVYYLPKLNIKGKDVLTVTGSGDQLINLVLMGAKKVDNYDLNINAYYMTQLKLAALKVLGYEDFLSFFTKCESEKIVQGMFFGHAKEQVNPNDKVFSYEVYLKLRKALPSDCIMYWDLMYNEFGNDGFNMSESRLFYGCDKKSAKENNAYLKDENAYNEVRNKIDNIPIEYYHTDLLNLHALENTYDVILLSNIYKYLVDEHYSIISEQDFNDYIKNYLSKRLNPKGVIQVAYKYNYKEPMYISKKSLWDLFRKKYTLNKEEFLSGCLVIEVPSINMEYRADGVKDGVYVWKDESSRLKK